MIFAPRNELTQVLGPCTSKAASDCPVPKLQIAACVVQAAIKSFWSMAIPSLIFVAFFIAASILEADNVAELLDKAWLCSARVCCLSHADPAPC